MNHIEKFIPILISLFLLASCSRPSDSTTTTEPNPIIHDHNRMAAEWEPALGSIIAWPLDIPKNLVIELANDGQLFTMVPDEKEKEEAMTWYKKWNIDLKNVSFILAPQGWDSWWVRDWGPFAVFTPNGTMKLADGQYEYSTPLSGLDCEGELIHIFTEKDSTGKEKILLTTIDDKAPDSIGAHMNFNMIELPFPFTGGNVFTDGRGTALSTCVIKNENRFIGGNEEVMLKKAKQLVGIQNYHFISNFEKQGIQHIDCFLKMLDEDRLLVARTPKDHPLHAIYENIVENELPRLRNVFGRSYSVLRLDTHRYHEDELAAYTNSLILNKTIYVPLFGIAQDSFALTQWQKAMPGYKIKGFEYKVDEEPILHPNVKQRRQLGLGWNGGDALHCRTRAMWDPKMLYLSVNRIPKIISSAKKYQFKVYIIDYSKKGLVENALQVRWREQGSDNWLSIPLIREKEKHNFSAIVPSVGAKKTIEYFFSAESKSGKKETMPRTAPEGFYHFSTE